MSQHEQPDQLCQGERKVEVDAESGHRSLIDHAVNKGLEIRARCGGSVDYDALVALLHDANSVRYPTHLAFDAVGVDAGMFAYAQQCGSQPGDGFVLHVHPHFKGRDEDLPLLIAYHLVVVNYGEIADAAVAEAFGAALLGLTVDDYYQRVCALADELANQPGGGSGGDSPCSEFTST